MAFRSILHLWATEFIPKPAHNMLSPSGSIWGSGFNKCTQYHYSSSYTGCNDGHLLCQPQSICLIEEEQSTCEPSFITACMESQARMFFALFSTLLCLSHLPGLLVGFVVRFVLVSLCPPFNYFLVLVLERLNNLFNVQHPYSFYLFLYQQLLSGKDIGNPEVVYTEVINKCCVLALKNN